MRKVTLTSGGGSVELGKASGIRMKSKLTGTGMPPVQAQWFEGAGDGASHRGTRVLARPMEIDFKVEGPSRQTVWDRYSLLARIFAPDAGEVRMEFDLDGQKWYNDLIRVGGGDFSWETDTDNETFIKTLLSVKAGNPYFTAVDSTSIQIDLEGLGRGLLKGSVSLSKLQLSTSTAFGSVHFVNPGDVRVFPIWTLEGPFEGFTFTSPTGEIIEWVGSVDLGEFLVVNTEFGTIKDDTGANRYGGVVGVPKFWSIPAGESDAIIEMDTPTADTRATALWNARKWMVF